MRLVDTIEKEATSITASLNEYKGMIDSIRGNAELDKKELALI